MNLLSSTIRAVVERYPALIPHLKGRARWIAIVSMPNYKYWFFQHGEIVGELHREPYGIIKTYDYYLQQLERLIRSVYQGNLGGEFIDIMANLISGQLTQAYEQAWTDEEGEGELPDYLASSLEDMILNEYDHVDQLYRDIVDARVDETPLDPLLSRAPLWANKWTDAYNRAVALITSENGGNLIWVYGDTEHCDSCLALNGVVARASEWEELGVHPQQPPNDMIDCGGWRCQCSLQPTEQRRSPKAYNTIMNIVQKG